MSEVAQALSWLVSTAKADSALTSAATGGVWEQYADAGTVAPIALIVHQSGSDVLTMNAKRLFAHLLFQVKGVGAASSYSTLITIADRIDALFGRIGPVTLSPGYVLSCYREQPFAYGELRADGKQWSHLGGLYHIELQGV